MDTINVAQQIEEKHAQVDECAVKDVVAPKSAQSVESQKIVCKLRDKIFYPGEPTEVTARVADVIAVADVDEVEYLKTKIIIEKFDPDTQKWVFKASAMGFCGVEDLHENETKVRARAEHPSGTMLGIKVGSP